MWKAKEKTKRKNSSKEEKREGEGRGDRSKRVKSWTCRLHNKKLIKRVRRERKRENEEERLQLQESVARDPRAVECEQRRIPTLASRCDFAMNHAARCTPMRRPSMVVPAVAQDNHWKFQYPARPVARARARVCTLYRKTSPAAEKTGIIFMKRKRYREKYIALHLTCRCTGGHVIKPMLCEVLPSIECDEMFLFLFASTVSPGPHVLAHTRMLHVPGYPPPWDFHSPDCFPPPLPPIALLLNDRFLAL